MQNSRPPVEAAGTTPQGPPWPRIESTVPPPFIPLRLRLQDCDLVVTLTKPDMTFGRHTDADVRLPLPDVSRRHCRFVFADGGWHVFDLDSLNGVHVNGVRVKQKTLGHNDTLRLGGFTFLVDLRAAEVSPVTEAFDPALTTQPGEVIQSISEALPLPVIDTRPKRQAS